MPDEPTDDAPAPRRRSRSRLYDADTGKLDVKKLAVWITGAAALVAALGALGTQVGGWAKMWLDVDDLEERATACEAAIEEQHARLHPTPPPPDANARLSEALPRISAALIEGRKERMGHDRAITRLTTIHEFGLTRSQAVEVAQSAREAVRARAGDRGTAPDDPLVAVGAL